MFIGIGDVNLANGEARAVIGEAMKKLLLLPKYWTIEKRDRQRLGVTKTQVFERS